MWSGSPVLAGVIVVLVVLILFGALVTGAAYAVEHWRALHLWAKALIILIALALIAAGFYAWAIMTAISNFH